MTNHTQKRWWSRRHFLAMSAVLPFFRSGLASANPETRGLRGAVANAAGAGAIPVGLEMYSVRNTLKANPMGTVRKVREMGYQGLEFFAPYFEWTPAQAKEMRRLLDDLGIRCFSTHNDSDYLSGEKLQHARELNLILGSEYIVMASSHEKPGLDGWREVAETLNAGAEKMEADGLKVGYHNHQTEFRLADGVRPMEILAKNTKPSVMLQLDVGTCIEAGSDPVAWIKANPGRIRSMHCKEWSPEAGKGYSVLFGEGVAPWKKLFEAAEHGGGIEYYLMEQEGSRFPELETAKKCLQAFRSEHG
jgi:sugar phosphate isomerase/epimerase